MSSSGSELISNLEARLGSEPGFISYDLQRWTGPEQVDNPLVGLDPETRRRLALCRSPRRDVAFVDDVMATASFTGIAADRLARFFRLLDAASSLRAAPKAQHRALLAAARDVVEEETTYVETPMTGAGIAAGFTPEWLASLTERFWGGEPPTDFPRNLDLYVLLRLPLAIVEVGGLRTADLNAFLGTEAAADLRWLPDRRLHGCVLAYGGVGVVFVDAQDDEAERRVNLAHEVGHFLLDYLAVRERLAARDPDLLDVMDGLRDPTPQEELSALLADVPLGVQTHLLERDRAGGYSSRRTGTVEDRAELVAWELLAPRGDVLSNVTNHGAASLIELLKDRFGLPAGVASSYGSFLARLTGPSSDRWLNLDE